jgi:hypothetical protein
MAVQTILKQLNTNHIVIVESVDIFNFTVAAVYIFPSQFTVKYMDLLAYYKQK